MGHSDTSKVRTATLALAALGVVFGDIGTSILYTFQECFHGHHPLPVSTGNILGITSLILWSLFLVVTVKYVGVMMNAENNGEGGILALLSLVPAQFRFDDRGILKGASFLGLAGAALLFGDGIITPAISVLSAMEGLEVANPDYGTLVVPGTIVILLSLFMIQSRGTGKIGRYFGAVILTWFGVVAVLGLKHLVVEPRALNALNPWYAVRFFQENGWYGFRILGTVILAVTGGEALYADMGHFGKRPIRLAWHMIVLPALGLNYLGQAALLIRSPGFSTQPFYSMIEPGPLYYLLVALATAATIIASQALITGAFSLTHQAIRLGLFPRVNVVHTSADLEGRVYIPSMNFMLAISCITIVFIFQRASRLASAYGLAVSGTMLFTTVLFYFVARYRWRWEWWKVIPLTVGILSIDIAFFLANIEKIPDGGYLPVIIGFVFFFSMTFWQYGRAKLSRFYREHTKTLESFIRELNKGNIKRIPGTMVVLASTDNRIPPALARAVEKLNVVHEHLLLVTVETEDEPYVSELDRARVSDLEQNCSRVVIKFGFMEDPNVPAVLSRCSISHLKSFPTAQTVYLLGRETFLINGDSFYERFRQSVFAFMNRNSRAAADYFSLPSKQVLELGSRLSV